jgi:hypothetical protein
MDRGPAGAAGEHATPPMPSGWAGQRPPAWLRLARWSMAAIAIGLAAEAAWLAWTGHPLAGVPLAGVAVLLGHVVALGRRTRWPGRRSSRTGTLTPGPDGVTGVAFTYSAWQYYLVTTLLVITELGVMAIGLGAALSATVAGAVG